MGATLIPSSPLESTWAFRFRWLVRGQVQGVGFRPFVCRLARTLGLTGWVRNSSEGVTIEAQGTLEAIESFEQSLLTQAPALARIADLDRKRLEPHANESDFVIQSSQNPSAPSAAVTPDAALCPECLADLRNPSDARRHGYALVNCTQCGPRYSLIRGIPYDRPNTTMAGFVLCPECQAEYSDPADRRFHAQPIACHHCGPKLELVDPSGSTQTVDPVTEAVTLLCDGKIVAIKGLGGYHLAVRADDESAVQRLRSLKHRPAKPLAIMVQTLEQARALVHLSAQAERLLQSPAAPIVLAERIAADSIFAPSVAPQAHRLGVLLAYTPLHHLIFDRAHGRLSALVMTSANDGDEPIVHADADAVERLGGLCDAILRHNRPIQRPVDDSVVIDAPAQPILARRARGYAPGPISLHRAQADTAPGLAVGAEMKNTACVVRGDQAILTQHLGDLTHRSTFDHFNRAIEDLQRLFQVEPQWVAHDLHPQYLSTVFARQLARANQFPAIAVQHHHAHAAAVMAEHAVDKSVLALVCDGTGYGTDGTIWGGELLLADRVNFRRLAHQAQLPLPGGDAAARQPWRSALALLQAALAEEASSHPLFAAVAPDEQSAAFVEQMLRTGTGCVASSSTGRLFDAVAALLGLCRENRFDAQAPMALESAAARQGFAPAWQDVVEMTLAEMTSAARPAGQPRVLGLSLLVRRILSEFMAGVGTDLVATRFHATLAALWAGAAADAAARHGCDTVVLAGGSFCNALLLQLLQKQLESRGLRALAPRLLPPNDGAICFGQAAVAAARLACGLNA